MSSSTSQQSSTLPAAQPVYIFRGHSCQIHSLHFCRQNTRLLSGDADGWVVIWDTVIKRPVVVWRAHENTILGINSWNDNRIITHGRDNKLKVWDVPLSDEKNFSTTLPVDDTNAHRQQPWMLHSLTVNTLNFCAFAMCSESVPTQESDDETEGIREPVLVAVPGVKDTEIDIFQLPSEKRLYKVPALPNKTGMIMCLSLYHTGAVLRVIAGYEGGHVALHQWDMPSKKWMVLSVSQPRPQPILSLDKSLTQDCYFTSGADDAITRHTLKVNRPTTNDGPELIEPDAIVHTKHSGQQSLRVRSDEKIFATAGWDTRVRIYSTKTMKEIAVLKWHKEGCYAVAFAVIQEDGLQPPISIEQEKREVSTVRQRRGEKAKGAHWLAAGSKDGKVSLWEIY